MKKYLVFFALTTAVLSSALGANIASKTTTTNSGAWGTGTNWVGNVVPGPLDNVTINGPITLTTNVTVLTLTVNAAKTFNVNGTSILTCTALSVSGFLVFNSSANITATSLTINSGGLFTLGGGGTVNLTGDFVNNGSYSDSSSGTISFNGTSTQTINNPSALSPVDFYNITIQNGAIVTLASPSYVNLNGMLTLNGTATFDADGSGTGVFAVKSGSTVDVARIAAIPSTAHITGQLTVERFIEGRTGGDYRYLSVPVQNETADAWKSAIGLTGNFTDPSTHAEYANVSNAGKTNPSADVWSIAANNYVAVGSGLAAASTPLSSKAGYSVYNFNDSLTDVVISYTGTIEQGDVTIITPTTANAFALVPNPYPAPIKWDFVYGPTIPPLGPNASAVVTTIYVRNGKGSYSFCQAGLPPPNPNDFDGEIAIGQSFWVQATSSSPSGQLIIGESAKISDPTVGATLVRKQTATNYVWFRLSSANRKDDWVAIRFVPDATDNQDDSYDAIKFPNDHMNLSTFISKGKYNSILGVQEISTCSRTFGLRVSDVTPGSYAIGFDDISKLESGYNMVLVDRMLNVEKSIGQGTSYPFSVSSDTASFGNYRFALRFEKALSKPTITAQGVVLTSSIASGNQWYKNGQIIQGATNSTYSVSSSGTYSVTTTSGSCNASSDNLTMSITGLGEISSALLVYPNPVQDIVTINLPQAFDTALTEVNLYDAQGVLVATSNKDSSLLKPGEKSIDLSTFKSGVYILNLVSGSQVKSIRLVKK